MPGNAPSRRGPSALALAAGLTTCLGAYAPRAEATVVRALTLEEKCKVAPLVVHGVVERSESRWEVPESRAETLVTIRVLESMKGDAKAGSVVTVHQGGGDIGDYHQHISGTSTFEQGEEVVLFLEPLGPYTVEIGVGIGKYAVTTSPAGKLVTHAPKVAGVQHDANGRMTVEPIPPMKPEPLATFLKRVRSAVQGISEPPPPAKKGLRRYEAPVAAPR